MKVKSESEVAQSCPTLLDPWIEAYQSRDFSRILLEWGAIAFSVFTLR